MAEQKTDAPKPPPPAPRPASSASVKVEPVTPKKSGFDLLRPFRYLKGFVTGTLTHGLDAMANGGRKGAKIGAITATLLVISGAIAGGSLATIAVGWMVGLAAGAALGGAVGSITGGVRGMDRETRKEKYADDLMRKAEAKSRPTPRVDYRSAHREYKQRNEYMFDRYIQQSNEYAADNRTYFQDHVNHSRSHGAGHGHGF